MSSFWRKRLLLELNTSIQDTVLEKEDVASPCDKAGGSEHPENVDIARPTFCKEAPRNDSSVLSRKTLVSSSHWRRRLLLLEEDTSLQDKSVTIIETDVYETNPTKDNVEDITNNTTATTVNRASEEEDAKPTSNILFKNLYK